MIILEGIIMFYLFKSAEMLNTNFIMQAETAYLESFPAKALGSYVLLICLDDSFHVRDLPHSGHIHHYPRMIIQAARPLISLCLANLHPPCFYK